MSEFDKAIARCANRADLARVLLALGVLALLAAWDGGHASSGTEHPAIDASSSDRRTPG
jgi:hypothetical protein